MAELKADGTFFLLGYRAKGFIEKRLKEIGLSTKGEHKTE